MYSFISICRYVAYRQTFRTIPSVSERCCEDARLAAGVCVHQYLVFWLFFFLMGDTFFDDGECFILVPLFCCCCCCCCCRLMAWDNGVLLSFRSFMRGSWPCSTVCIPTITSPNDEDDWRFVLLLVVGFIRAAFLDACMAATSWTSCWS